MACQLGILDVEQEERGAPSPNSKSKLDGEGGETLVLPGPDPLSILVQMQPPASNPTTKRHSTQDPNLVVFYARLRDKLSKESRTSPVQISPKAEWDLVIRSARLYLRMGCDMLALDLGTFLSGSDTNARLTQRGT